MSDPLSDEARRKAIYARLHPLKLGEDHRSTAERWKVVSEVRRGLWEAYAPNSWQDGSSQHGQVFGDYGPVNPDRMSTLTLAWVLSNLSKLDASMELAREYVSRREPWVKAVTLPTPAWDWGTSGEYHANDERDYTMCKVLYTNSPYSPPYRSRNSHLPTKLLCCMLDEWILAAAPDKRNFYQPLVSIQEMGFGFYFLEDGRTVLRPPYAVSLAAQGAFPT